MSEHSEQVAVLRWVRLNEKEHPDLKFLFAVPNGSLRNPVTAMKLKLEGVRPGVPDLMWPCKNKEHAGLAIEMKFGKNKTSGYQDLWLEFLKSNGWKTAICYTAGEAIKIIAEYREIYEV